jgi:hypothetical protein
VFLNLAPRHPSKARGTPFLYRLAFGQLSEGNSSITKINRTTKVDSIMSDPEVATKAPESDAAGESEASLIPGDTPAQSGASLGVSWSSFGVPSHC